MSFDTFNKKSLSFIATGLFMVIGTYNAVVINSESSISSVEMKFVKRLDEVYGVTESARGAASIKWQKMNSENQIYPKLAQTPRSIPTIETKSAPETQAVALAPTAAVQEELDLTLTEVVNPKKWQQGLNNSQYTGSLVTNGGVIESLSVSLPNGEGVSVSFSEMAGNVFEYDLGGELYSGMMYQVDQNSYMVTLTNGPLEGTRLKFTGEPSLEQQEQTLAAQSDAEQNVDMAAYSNNGQDTAQTESEIGYVPPQGMETVQAQEQAPAQDPDASFQQQALQDPENQQQGFQMLQGEQAMQELEFNPEQQNQNPVQG